MNLMTRLSYSPAMRLTGKRALVIGGCGGGGGIGRATTGALGNEGAAVLVADVDLERTGDAIVSVGSVTGFMAAPEQAAYGVMKAGVLSLARTVAAEYARDGIRMNVAAAGGVSVRGPFA